MKKNIISVLLVMCVLIPMLSTVTFAVEDNLYEMKQSTGYTANIKSNYLIYYDSVNHRYWIATSDEQMIVKADGTTLGTGVYLLRIDYYNGNFTAGEFAQTGYGDNIYTYITSPSYGNGVLLEKNCTVIYEDTGNSAVDENGNLRPNETDEPVLPIMVTADSEGITVHNLDPIPSEVNQLYALKLQSSLETTEVTNIYFKETYIPYESLSKPINAGTYIYRVVHIENPANTSAYTELGRGLVKIPSEITNYHVPRPKNVYVYTTMNTANPSASTIYVSWEMDKTKYNTRLEYRLKDSEEWVQHGIWEREVNPIFDVPNPFLVVPFVENIEFLRLINIDRVTGQESLPTLYSYEEDTEIGEVDIDPGDNPFIPDELKQDEMSVVEAISHANEYLKEGMNSLTFMGQVYEILPSPIPEAIAFVIVFSVALFIIKIVRG